jgi:hypothetical protein
MCSNSTRRITSSLPFPALTRTVPILDRPENVSRLREIEAAKRRVLFALQHMDMPVIPKSEDAERGLAFDFLEALPDGPPVLTGHADGVITLNAAEADDDYCEKNRENLREPYRTVVGHIRHELGHYYWDVLLRDTSWLPRFREVFGDERGGLRRGAQETLRRGPAGRLARPLHQRLRCLASLGGLGGVVGALHAYVRHAGDGDELPPGDGRDAAKPDPVLRRCAV